MLGVLFPPYAPLLERASPSDDKVPLPWLISAAFQGRDSALFQLCGSCVRQFVYPSIHLATIYRAPSRGTGAMTMNRTGKIPARRELTV